VSEGERYARRGPQGATGKTGERGEAGMDTKSRHAIVYLFLLAAALSATCILFTVGYVRWTSSHQHAAQEKAAIPVCMALLHLSQVQGTHGDSGATYGQNLQAAFQQVYRATNCPHVMKAAR
jgi:hypothetical protein